MQSPGYPSSPDPSPSNAFGEIKFYPRGCISRPTVFSQVDLAVKTGKSENLIESWNGPYIDPQSSKLIQFGPRPLRGAPFASIAHFVLRPSVELPVKRWQFSAPFSPHSNLSAWPLKGSDYQTTGYLLRRHRPLLFENPGNQERDILIAEVEFQNLKGRTLPASSLGDEVLVWQP
jgi:hypothetical protein